MILLDTHAWIWWVTESPKLSDRARASISEADKIGVSAITCWEVAMLVAKRRIGLHMDVQEWIDTALKFPRVMLVSLEPRIAVLATRLPEEFHADPVDRFIAATCLAYDISLVSKDQKITEWGHVSVIW